tara:strand:+ start:67 stop:366 length:300 start_codon:yes stop_codon:yes gene_type:complete
MFTKELDAGTKVSSEIGAKRETIQNRFKSGSLKMALQRSGESGGSSGAGGVMAKLGKSSKCLLAAAAASSTSSAGAPAPAAPMAYTDPASAKKPLLSRT